MIFPDIRHMANDDGFDLLPRCHTRSCKWESIRNETKIDVRLKMSGTTVVVWLSEILPPNLFGKAQDRVSEESDCVVASAPWTQILRCAQDDHGDRASAGIPSLPLSLPVVSEAPSERTEIDAQWHMSDKPAVKWRLDIWPEGSDGVGGIVTLGKGFSLASE